MHQQVGLADWTHGNPPLYESTKFYTSSSTHSQYYIKVLKVLPLLLKRNVTEMIVLTTTSLGN